MVELSPLLHVIAENLFLYGVMFIVTIAIVIVVHEFGHYLAAKLCGVHIEQFSFGFGKEILGIGGRKRNSSLKTTRWSICLLPIGGYVKLFGDVDVNDPQLWDSEVERARTLTDEELDVAFCTKSVWQRMFIVAAGPAINIVLTLCIFCSVFTLHGELSNPLVINQILVGAPADQANIKLGDQIINMDGKSLRRLDDLHDITMGEMPPKPHKYTIMRDGKLIDITFTARIAEYINRKGVAEKHGQTGMAYTRRIGLKYIKSVDGIGTNNAPGKARELIAERFGKVVTIDVAYRDEVSRGISGKDEFIAIIPAEYNTHFNNPQSDDYKNVHFVDVDRPFYLRIPIYEALTRSFSNIYRMTASSFKLIAVAYKGKTDEPVIGGIGKISEKTGDAVKGGIYDYMMFIAGFSFMIALVNLMPIPVLDGGFLIFLTYEALTGRPVSPRFQSIALIIGLVFLLGIMIIANITDFVSYVNETFDKT